MTTVRDTCMIVDAVKGVVSADARRILQSVAIVLNARNLFVALL